MKSPAILALAPTLTTASSTPALATASSESILTRAIPNSGEMLPVIGVGTSRTFDVGTDVQARARLLEVLQTLVEAGGSVVDSSPMYGSAEMVVGDLIESSELADQLFFATKVWTQGQQAGVEQMQRSFELMRVKQMDLMQVHNLIDTDAHFETLNKWKQQGLIRYTGITHYHPGGYAEMLRAMQKHPMDFIQINYSMISRGVEEEILPLAQERDIAVLINRPYERGELFSRVKDIELPGWAAEFDCASWGQFFLKYLLANPAVTCLIPGTSKPHHLRDNLAAGRGRLPNTEQRTKMLGLINSI